MAPPFPPDLSRIGVLGAGTMGSGIALAALLADLKVTLYDLEASMLERAQGYIESHLKRKQRSINLKYLTLASDLEELSGSGVVIEAAPENLSIKQDLFARLDKVCPEPAILATNTSTLPVTAIAATVKNAGRVGGMHFFNPAPVMPLIEIVRAAQTSQETIQALAGLARRMGKTPVIVRDTPGFIVNRVARPFYGEALRLAGEGVASYEAIDHIVELGGGFRMGPFRLMDLIGIDINYAATRSVWEQTFYEPRYRPHLIQAQMVQAGRLGRKTGRGFYHYDPEVEGKKAPPSPTAPELLSQVSQQDQEIVFQGDEWAPGMPALISQAGYSLIEKPSPDKRIVAGVLARKRDELLPRLLEFDLILPPEIPVLIQCAEMAYSEAATRVRHPQRLVGFDGLFFANGPVCTLVEGPSLSDEARRAVEKLCIHLGRQPEWIKESPGLVLPRIVCMLANEAAFALGEGVADAQTIDQAMQLGTSYPHGPLAWAGVIGIQKVVSVLDHLYEEFGEERYRTALVLRRMVRMENRHYS